MVLLLVWFPLRFVKSELLCVYDFPLGKLALQYLVREYRFQCSLRLRIEFVAHIFFESHQVGGVRVLWSCSCNSLLLILPRAMRALSQPSLQMAWSPTQLTWWVAHSVFLQQRFLLFGWIPCKWVSVLRRKAMLFVCRDFNVCLCDAKISK